MKVFTLPLLALSLLAVPQQAPPPVITPPANYVHVATLDMTGPQIVAMPLWGANPPVYTMIPGQDWHGPFPLSTLAGPGDAVTEGYASVTFCAVQVVRGFPYGAVKTVGQKKEITLSATSPYGSAGAASDIHEQLNALGQQGFVPVPCDT